MLTLAVELKGSARRRDVSVLTILRSVLTRDCQSSSSATALLVSVSKYAESAPSLTSLCTPALRSEMNASSQSAPVETALNSDKVRPAANGCCHSAQLLDEIARPHLGITGFILVSHMDALHADLDIIDGLLDHCADIRLRGCR